MDFWVKIVCQIGKKRDLLMSFLHASIAPRGNLNLLLLLQVKMKKRTIFPHSPEQTILLIIFLCLV